MKRHWLSITLIIVLYIGLASIYSLLTPLGEGPDEPGHAKYVFFLAREGRLPIQCAPPCVGEVPGEGHQPPLAYTLMLPALLWMPREERSFDLPGNSHFVWLGGQELNAAGHGSREFWPWKGEVLAWHLARLINVLLGSLTVLFTYLAARIPAQQFGLGKSAAYLAALLVALNPQFLFTSGLINNDSLLTSLSALALWLLLREWQTREQANSEHGERGSFILIGLVLGLALLTKQSAFLLVPIALLACGLSFEHGRWMLGKGLRRAVGMLLMATLVAGWWYLRNWQLYGDPLGISVFLAEFRTQAFDARSMLAWRDALVLLHVSFWARFGWMNLPVPAPMIWFYGLIEILGLIGLCILIYQIARYASQRLSLGSQLSMFAILLAFPLLSIAWVVSFALSAGLVAWQGRLLFPALPAIAVLLGLGIQTLRLRGHRQPGVRAGEQGQISDMPSSNPSMFVIIFMMLLIAAWLPFGVIRAAYPAQTLPESVALSRIVQPYSIRFADRPDEQGAELRSLKLDGLAQPGETMTITLLWHALGRQNRDWSVFIHLVDVQEHILAEANGEPRQANFRMSLWSKGDWVEDQHRLVLPTTLAPGSYMLRLGLWDPLTQGRAGVFNSRNKLIGDFLEIGNIEIRNR